MVPRALWTKAPVALLRHPVGFLAVFVAALLIAMGAAAAPLMNAGTESEALQNTLAQLTPLGAGLTIERDGLPQKNLAAADARRRAAAVALGRLLPAVGAPILTTTTYVRISGHLLEVGNPLLVVAMARTAATAHVQKLAGDGRGAWFSGAIAQLAHLEPGKTAELVPASLGLGHVSVRVGAIYRQLDLDLSNPYWVDFIARIRAVNPDAPLPPTFVLVSPREVYRLAQTIGDHTVSNVYEFPIDPHAMTPQRAEEIARSFESVRRLLAGRTALARSLGCSPCRVTSSVVDAVRLASAGNAALSPVVALLGGLCVLLAVAAAVVAGSFTARRRAGETRLSLVLGEHGAAFWGRAAIEAFAPALAGAAVGLAAAIALARVLAPSGAIDSSVFAHATLLAAGSVALSAFAVAAGATVARGRLAPRSRVVRPPWELPVALSAAAAWIVVSSGGGLVRNETAGSHPRLAVLVLPGLVAAVLAGAGTRALRLALGGRKGMAAPMPVFLALRRVAAARGLVVMLTVTIAVGVAALAFAQILRSSLAANSVAKAYVANGSDVQGVIAPGPLPASFPYPVTEVTETFDAGRFASGQSFELIAVEPHSLERVLAAHWPAGVRKAVRSLADSHARLPAIALGSARGWQTVSIAGTTRAVDVVATVRVFPGIVADSGVLVVPARALAAAANGPFSYVWASGPPDQVQRALGRSSLRPTYLTKVTEISQSADVTTITRTYGLLRVLALAFAVIALAALVLYLNARARSQLVTSEFMRCMGLPDRAQALSVALEATLLVAFATAVGLVSALAASGVIVDRVDPLPQYAPAAATTVPWVTLLGAGVAVVAAAALVAGLVTAAARRGRIGEALRVA